MSVTTLRPNGTASSSGVAITGAANAHSALSDNSDSSYVYFDNGDLLRLNFGDIALPAGAMVKLLTVRARLARVTSNQVIGVALIEGSFGGQLRFEQLLVNWASPTTVSAVTYPVALGFGDADVDGLLVELGAQVWMPPTLDHRVYEVYLDVTYVEKPALAVDAPTDESTVADTNRPSISWTPDLDSDGGAQTRYEVVVVADGDDPDADPRIAESGVVSGNGTSWQVDEPLADGAYDLYVRIAQSVNSATHWSDWSTKTDFTIDVLLPAVPSVTLVPETANGRIRVDIEEGAGGDATTDIFEVQASDDDGETWRTLRTVAGWGLVEPDAGTAMAWDREGANGSEVTYRVRAGHDYSGLFAWSASVEETGMWGPTRTCWLKHPLDASQDLAVRIDAYGESSIAARQNQMHPLGRSSVIIAADKHGPETGAVTFLLPDQDSRDALKTLLRANPATPFLLQVGAADKRPDRWVIFGQIDTAYIIDKSWIDDTRETLGWVEVNRP